MLEVTKMPTSSLWFIILRLAEFDDLFRCGTLMQLIKSDLLKKMKLYEKIDYYPGWVEFINTVLSLPWSFESLFWQMIFVVRSSFPQLFCCVLVLELLLDAYASWIVIIAIIPINKAVNTRLAITMFLLFIILQIS